MNIRKQRKNSRRFRSRVNPTQQKGAAITIGLLTIIVLISMIATPNEKTRSTLRQNERMEKMIGATTEKPKKTMKDYGDCTVRTGKIPDHKIQSTFTASYPGSGAKMTWKLIEAMTGLVTGDDFQLNGHDNIVSIKTHYPSSEGRPLPEGEFVPRAMLLIRNPLHSIPSYFNFVYEFQNKLPGHSTKAPLEEWMQWRNANFERQLQVWRAHTEYWMNAYDKAHRIVIAYENLIDDDKGADEASKIAEFLNRSDGVSTVSPKEVPCIWYSVIKYKKRRRLQEGADPYYENLRPGVMIDPIITDPPHEAGVDQNEGEVEGFVKSYPSYEEGQRLYEEELAQNGGMLDAYSAYTPDIFKDDLDGVQQTNEGTTQHNEGTTQHNEGTTQHNEGTTQHNEGTTQHNEGLTQDEPEVVQDEEFDDAALEALRPDFMKETPTKASPPAEVEVAQPAVGQDVVHEEYDDTAATEVFRPDPFKETPTGASPPAEVEVAPPAVGILQVGQDVVQDGEDIDAAATEAFRPNFFKETPMNASPPAEVEVAQPAIGISQVGQEATPYEDTKSQGSGYFKETFTNASPPAEVEVAQPAVGTTQHEDEIAATEAYRPNFMRKDSEIANTSDEVVEAHHTVDISQHEDPIAEEGEGTDTDATFIENMRPAFMIDESEKLGRAHNVGEKPSHKQEATPNEETKETSHEEGGQAPHGEENANTPYEQGTSPHKEISSHNDGQSAQHHYGKLRNKYDENLPRDVGQETRFEEEKKPIDDIQSKRGGPKYIAPYSPQQLKDLIEVLTKLLEQYRDDKDLAPVLVSYIDDAARRLRGPPEDENTVVVETLS